MKNAKDVQDNLPRYIDLLATYSNSIQEAYRELAAQRKRGGTASKGIDKDITEAKVDLTVPDVDPKFKAIAQQAIIKYPYANDVLDAVLHMMMDQMKKDNNQEKNIDRLDKENDKQDDEIDNIENDIRNLTFAREHCGDPMADDHKPVRMLLMKLYQKEMQCEPGSPEHFEVVKMIDGCRKNIGLDENVVTNIINKVKSDFKKRKQLLGKGTTADETK